MLNRRLLRAKLMQALYAASILEEAAKSTAQHNLKEIFRDEVLQIGKENWLTYEEDYKAASIAINRLLEKNQEESEHNILFGLNAFQNEAVKKIVRDWESQVKKDRMQPLLDLKKEAEDNQRLCALVLQFLVETARQAFLVEESKNLQTPFNEKWLSDNLIIKVLDENQELNTFYSKYTLNRADFSENVKSIYNSEIRESEEYHSLLIAGQGEWEKDSEMVKFLLRNYFGQSERSESFWESQSSRWMENHKAILSMAARTIKAIEESEGKEIVISEISANWEEDWEFTKTLYSKTLENREEFEGLISKQSKNWDFSRISPVDKQCLYLALAEMMYFPSIPVKVSINEYLEVVKKYGTPKSRLFVNGLLDTLSNQLMEEGKIRKSGKGLMDNK